MKTAPTALEEQVGHPIIVGMDEAGRGALWGRLYVGAACLDWASPHLYAGVYDSKTRSRTSREKLFHLIDLHARAWGAGWVEAGEIDGHGLTQAVQIAAARALSNLKTRLPVSDVIDDRGTPPKIEIGHILSDSGLLVRDLEGIPYTTHIRGDQLSLSIAAASIVAKVMRDRWIDHVAPLYPRLSLTKHWGYPTPEHLTQLRVYGVTDQHRRSYVPVSDMMDVKQGGAHE